MSSAAGPSSRGQSRWGSFIEAIVNTAFGLVVSIVAATWLLPLFGIVLSFRDNVVATLVMTLVAVARQYAVRRAFVIWGGRMTHPLAIDLFCGLGGWTAPLLDAGYYVVGFDIERHEYGSHRYPAQLVIQDVLTLHGSQFRGAVLIVASPPCQFFSYTAMPWTRAKELAEKTRADPALLEQRLALFKACFRIQREACEAAGRHIPLIVENVRGAIPWVGRSAYNFGSFHLWGDVPALMPIAARYRKVPGFRFDGSGRSFQTASVDHHSGIKQGGDWFSDSSPGTLRSFTGTKQPGIGGERANGKGDAWFQDGAARHGSKPPARKAASAMIAKIPAPLAEHIARTFHPEFAGR